MRHLRSAASLAILCLVSSCTLTPTPQAERPQKGIFDAAIAREGDRNLLVGAGFTSGPGTALLAAQADFYLTDDWAVGPAVQLGLSDDDILFAPTFQAKRVFGTHNIETVAWRPFAQAGLGMLALHRDQRGGNRSDEGVLITGGGGIEVFLGEDSRLASTLMAHVMPDKVLGDRSYISWQVLQLQIRF